MPMPPKATAGKINIDNENGKPDPVPVVAPPKTENDAAAPKEKTSKKSAKKDKKSSKKAKKSASKESGSPEDKKS
jgi:hypothetical protein